MAEWPQRLAVVGAGLIGGSIALASRAAGVPRVVVTDASPDVRTRALHAGVADEVAVDLPTACAGADLVIAAVPARAVATVLRDAAAHAAPGALLTDAASLKSASTLEVVSTLRPEVAARFVGGHPMAGSERSGPEAADATLFQGATWILTPTPASADGALHDLTSFVRRLGARAMVLPPDRHDELVALVSHLPHVVAAVLAAVASDAVEAQGDAVLAVAGGGFRDTTRIAAGDPELWLSILQGNQDPVGTALRAFADRLEAVRNALDAGRWEELSAVLHRARDARQRLVPKTTQDDLVDLVVALADRPGQLAVATRVLGEAGINIEDLAMRHASTGERGVLVVRVAASAQERARAVLADAGLEARVDGVERTSPTA